jgi:hypothetical protein
MGSRTIVTATEVHDANACATSNIDVPNATPNRGWETELCVDRKGAEEPKTQLIARRQVGMK